MKPPYKKGYAALAEALKRQHAAFVAAMANDPTTDEEAEREGQRLWDEGYRQTSRRYRNVSKNGEFRDGLELSIKVFKAFKSAERKAHK
jgi:hypothetical protein